MSTGRSSIGTSRKDVGLGDVKQIQKFLSSVHKCGVEAHSENHIKW